MSAFERRRLENIANNQTILKDLANTSKKMMPAAKPAAKQARSTRANVKKEPAPPTRIMPTRRSARVAGLDADNETLKRKYEVELEDQAAKEKAKRTRVSGDLKLDDIAVEGKKWNNGINTLGALLPRGAQPGVPTFTEEDVDNTSDKDLKELRQKINGLQLYDKWIPNGKRSHPPSRALPLTSCRHQNLPPPSLQLRVPPDRGKAAHFRRRQRRCSGHLRRVAGWAGDQR